MEIWVLGEQVEFDASGDSGGTCIYGLYTSASAALFALGVDEIGLDLARSIAWHAWAKDCYEGEDQAGTRYDLRAYVARTEVTVRATRRQWERAYALPPSPYHRLSTAALLAQLEVSR